MRVSSLGLAALTSLYLGSTMTPTPAPAAAPRPVGKKKKARSRQRQNPMKAEARRKMAEKIAQQRIDGLPDKYKHAYARNAGLFRT